MHKKQHINLRAGAHLLVQGKGRQQVGCILLQPLRRMKQRRSLWAKGSYLKPQVFCRFTRCRGDVIIHFLFCKFGYTSFQSCLNFIQLMLVKQEQTTHILVGMNPTHKMEKLGMVVPIALLTVQFWNLGHH